RSHDRPHPGTTAWSRVVSDRVVSLVEVDVVWDASYTGKRSMRWAGVGAAVVLAIAAFGSCGPRSDSRVTVQAPSAVTATTAFEAPPAKVPPDYSGLPAHLGPFGWRDRQAELNVRP